MDSLLPGLTEIESAAETGCCWSVGWAHLTRERPLICAAKTD
jgi:hypothetical protein